MSTAPPSSLAPAISRPVTLRIRGDLTAERVIYQGQSYWVLKEPVGLNYYRFPEESYFVMNLLDGRRSLDEIREAYNERFAPKKLQLEKLQSFVGSLHRAGLLQSAATGLGHSLLKKRKKTRRQKLFSKFGNVLAVRFRGVDPERILNRILPYTSWIFARPTVIFVMSMALVALISIGVNWDEFLNRLPTFNQFFDPVSWLSLGVVLAFTKILHEFGHGISCKRFGGECHEMGFMLLVLTPCLYCNVSDSWTLKSKWHRAAIGAAGIYVEIILASIATFVWWFTAPGFLNSMALQVMTICSISTILFNGNPLLRFDGYYIMSDLLEIPNLQQKSSQAMTDFLKKKVLGIKHTNTTMMPTRNRPMFILYAFASIIYRWFIVFAILLFLNRVFEPYGLQIIGRIIAAMSIGTLLGVPIYKLIKFFRNPSMRYQIRMQRALITIGIIAAVVIGILSIPFPYYVHCDFTVRSRDSVNLFVKSPGEVKQILVEPWQTVTQDQPIAILENLSLQRQYAETLGEIAEKQSQLKALRTQSLRDNFVAQSALSTAEAELATLQEVADKTAQKIEELTLVAPREGTLLPVVDTAGGQSQQNREVGGPLQVFDAKNKNAYLTVGMPICAVGDPDKLEVLMSIPEGRIAFVKPTQDVQIKPFAFALKTIDAKVLAVGRLAISPPTSPDQAQGGLGGAMANAVVSPQNLYFATANLTDGNEMGLKVGSQGKARIRCGSRSWGSRISRWAADTFRFQ